MQSIRLIAPYVAGLDVSGFSHALDSFAISKVYKDHGTGKSELSRGQIPVTREDFMKIPDIVANYDAAKLVGKDSAGIDLIQYKKRYSDGKTYYVVEVRTRRNELMAKTLWKTRTSTRATSKEGVAHTSETLDRNPPQSKVILPQPPDTNPSKEPKP